MHANNSYLRFTAILSLLFFASVIAPPQAAAQEETILHNFHTGSGGHNPSAGLVFDSAGNLYGTTQYGGPSTCKKDTGGCGTLYELTPKTGGGWTEKMIHNFGSGNDGFSPSSGLILDAAGNLYGVTSFGGNGSCSCGIVYEFTRERDGSWTETILYSFAGGTEDGAFPYGNLAFDSVGNLYGTTSFGGVDNNDGVVFELAPSASGKWTETILHFFGKSATDGYNPNGSLVFDTEGNFYGTTINGGVNGEPYGGTAFQFKPKTTTKSGGGWTYSVIYSFGGTGPDNPSSPASGLILDGAGNLYGTTNEGGSEANGGTVFELSPKSGGSWKEDVLYVFTSANGYSPFAPVIMSPEGNLYGTTSTGGANNIGTAFELTPTRSGPWTETILHSFGDGNDDGQEPEAGMILDESGNLYGTTFDGGTFGNDCPAVGPSCGTVFKIAP